MVDLLVSLPISTVYTCMTYFVYLRPCQLPSACAPGRTQVELVRGRSIRMLRCSPSRAPNMGNKFSFDFPSPYKRLPARRKAKAHTTLAAQRQRNERPYPQVTFSLAALRSTARGPFHTGHGTQGPPRSIHHRPSPRVIRMGVAKRPVESTCTLATPPLPPLSRPLLLFSSFITTEGEADDIPPAASRLWGHPRER